MNETFSSQLHRLRTAARLTNEALARLADVPESLVSGLQNDNRRIGEYQARKIGTALRLQGDELEQFIYDAINNCSQKVLVRARSYPAQLLNLLAVQLQRAGIGADTIRGLTVDGDDFEQDVQLTLTSGKQATLKTHLVCA